MAKGNINQRRLIAKPLFPNGAGAFMVDQDHLSPALKAELWEALPPTLGNPQKSHFLSLTGQAVQLALLFQNRQEAADTTYSAIVDVQHKARALLGSLNKLTDSAATTMHVHGVALPYLENPHAVLSVATAGVATQRSGSPLASHAGTDSDDYAAACDATKSAFMAHLWDMVQDVETVAWFSASQITKSKTSKPTRAFARGLVRQVAEAYRFAAGKLPPGGKEAWFSKYMRELGQEAARATIGPAIVDSVLKEMQESGRYVDCLPCPIPRGSGKRFTPPKKSKR